MAPPPTPPPGCDDEGGPPGSGPNDPGDDPGNPDDPNDDGDPPPECDSMSIVGPAFVEVSRAATFVVSGNPPGTVRWDVSPYPTGPLRPASTPSSPNYTVRGVSTGQAMVIASVRDGDAVICAESVSVVILDCLAMSLNGPTTVNVGGEAVFTISNVPQGVVIEWVVEGDLTRVSETGESIVVRGRARGSGSVTAHANYDGEQLSCEPTADLAVVCDFVITGPSSLVEEEVATYRADERHSNQRISWSTFGPLSIVGPSDQWTVQVTTEECGQGILFARLFDSDGLPVGCLTQKEIQIELDEPEPIEIAGAPERGYIQIPIGGAETEVLLTASGEGDFRWEVTSTEEGAIDVEGSAAQCTVRIVEPSTITARVIRTHCDVEITAQIVFTAIALDLAIDSNNDGAVRPDDDVIEEDAPGHVILATTLDADADGIPDYADGIGLMPGYAPAATLTDGEFSPVVLTLSNLGQAPSTRLT